MQLSWPGILGLALALSVMAAPIELPEGGLSTFVEDVGSEVKAFMNTEDSNIESTVTDTSPCGSGLSRRGVLGCFKWSKGKPKNDEALAAYMNQQAVAIYKLPDDYQPYAMGWVQAEVDMMALRAKLGTGSTKFVRLIGKMNVFVQEARNLMTQKAGSAPLTWQLTGRFDQDLPNMLKDIQRLSEADLSELDASWSDFWDSVSSEMQAQGLEKPAKKTSKSPK